MEFNRTEHLRKLNAKNTKQRHDSAADRFWARVIKGNRDECWPWYKNYKWADYPPVSFKPFFKNNQVGAHRVAYFLTHGIISTKSNCVCHRCNNKQCCNPNHLYLGTPVTNGKDMIRAGSWKSPTTKLTTKQVKQIRQIYPDLARGQKTNYAASLGVTQGCLARVVNRTSWKTV